MSDTRQIIADAFRQHGPMTIVQAMHITGTHTETIRRYVLPPHYRAVGSEWATRQWEVTWEIVPDVAELPKGAATRNYRTGPQATTLCHAWGLTRREWDIVEALCAGHEAGAELAQYLDISARTIQTHLYNIFSKLHIRSKTALILKVLDDEAARARCFPHLRIFGGNSND